MKNVVFVLAGLQTLLTTIYHATDNKDYDFAYTMNNLKRIEKMFQR